MPVLSLLFPPARPFEPPSLAHHLLTSPISFLLHALHPLLRSLHPSPPSHPTHPIRIVCLSDTHTHFPARLPPGDLLIHAGDLTNAGTHASIQSQLAYLNTLPHPHKVVIAGNHDSFLDPASRALADSERNLDWGTIHYLERSSVTLTFPDKGGRQLHVYGAPHIPACGGEEFAFQYPRGEDRWTGTVPRETDVLVTHTPPRWHLDLPQGLGCEWLLREVWRVRPRVHVFGHVHGGYGVEKVGWDEGQRAYERLAARRSKGLVRDVLDLWAWVALGMVVWEGVKGVLWTRVWGGEERGGGRSIMVNAALMYRNTGKLGNDPQVVVI